MQKATNGMKDEAKSLADVATGAMIELSLISSGRDIKGRQIGRFLNALEHGLDETPEIIRGAFKGATSRYMTGTRKDPTSLESYMSRLESAPDVSADEAKALGNTTARLCKQLCPSWNPVEMPRRNYK